MTISETFPSLDLQHVLTLLRNFTAEDADGAVPAPVLDAVEGFAKKGAPRVRADEANPLRLFSRSDFRDIEMLS